MKRLNLFLAVTVLAFGAFFSSCTPDTPVQEVALTAVASSTTIYCTLADGSTNSTCASADGTTYSPKTATATQQAKVDFVYFNLSGTSYGIYSPSSIPTVINTTTNNFVNWTTKNTTYFSKTTDIFSSATNVSDIQTIADAATSTSVTGLAANDVVVFKTAAGKVGLFKVVSITTGYGATDKVVVDIKVEP